MHEYEKVIIGVRFFYALAVFLLSGLLSLDDQVFVNLPNFCVGKIFNPQNILYIPPVKNFSRLEFEQIP